CARGSRRLVKNRSMASPPYSPGGKLIECTTSSETTLPAGRSSQLGEATRRAPATQRSGLGVVFLTNAQALQAVAQLPEGDAEQARRRSAVESRLGKRRENRIALQPVEV